MAKLKDTRGQRVQLTSRQRRWLAEVQRREDVDALSARRARILELLGAGWRQSEVAEATGAGIATVGRTRRRFLQEGLESTVWGYKAPGREPLFDAKQEARIVAVACSQPPDGRDRWTVRLLAEEVVRRGIADTIGREKIRLVLKEHGIKPWREKNVVRG